MKNRWRKLVAGGLAASMTVMMGTSGVYAADKDVEINLLSHRYAALEYYA